MPMQALSGGGGSRNHRPGFPGPPLIVFPGASRLSADFGRKK